MTKISLKAEVRKVTGRKVKGLRKEGVIPANIFGKDIKSVSIQLDSKEFREVFKKAGETGIIEIKIGKEDRPVLTQNVQVHPATDEILHVDFRQVNLKEKVTANIPVELVGESPAEKSGAGTVVMLIQELEVEALPAELPENFQIDASLLTEVDQTVKISDLKYDKAKIAIASEPDTILVKVEPPQKEEVVVAPAAVEGEAPATEGEAKPAEGEPAAVEVPAGKEEKKA